MVSGKKTLESLFDATRTGAREKTSFNLHKPTYDRFKAICQRYNTTPTEAINALLADVVAEYEESGQTESTKPEPLTPPTQPTPQPPISPRGKARTRPHKG